MVELSNLEFAHDRFVLAVNEKAPEIAGRLSKGFPRQFQQKVDFLIKAIMLFPNLRKVPIFGDGSLKLQWLQYQLDELYELRTVLAHGSISLTKTNKRGTTWRFDRVTNRRKKTWGEVFTWVGGGVVADVYTTSHHLKHYIWRLKEALEGRSDWEEDYKSELKIRRNREAMRELADFGILKVDPSWAFLLKDIQRDK